MLSARQYCQLRTGVITAQGCKFNGQEYIGLNTITTMVEAYVETGLERYEADQMIGLVAAQGQMEYGGVAYVLKHNTMCIMFEFVEWSSTEQRNAEVRYLNSQRDLIEDSPKKKAEDRPKNEPPVLQPMTLLDRVRWVVSGVFRSRV